MVWSCLRDLDYEEATVIKESALKYVLVADKVGLFNELVIYIGLVMFNYIGNSDYYTSEIFYWT